MSVVFCGFDAGMTKIPSQFFEEVLPEIDCQHELKVLLFAFYLLNQYEGDQRYLMQSDFFDLAPFMAGLDPNPDQAAFLLSDGLEKCTLRGTLLKIDYADESLYFLNSPKGRSAVEKLQTGQWMPDAFLHLAGTVNLFRPNIFQLYEENIGPLTPLIAERLKEAEVTYPDTWVEDAIEQAVVNNARSWRYIETILKSWKENGRDGSYRKAA